MIRHILFATFVLFCLPLLSQNDTIKKEIYGKIYDSETRQVLPGASIQVKGTSKGTVTDENGNFMMEVPLGRTTLEIFYISYKSESVSLLVTSGKDPYIEIPMQPKAVQLDEAVIEAEHDKSETVNPAIYGSGRSFNVEDAYRYAGTLGDPARMVRSFAGVVPERDDRNDIIIRGNSPTGILWRLDGIEIPNPNHFGGIGLTGNTTTLLNMNLLDNSDFLTGAFPSSYGNATAGVFDLNMRRPNPKKHQFWFQTGWNGLEAGAEGPLNKKSDNPASFMTVYRYSFLQALSHFDIDYGVLPKFQDFTTKVQIPVSDKLELSVLGMATTSSIDLDDRDSEEDYTPATPYGTHTRTGSDLNIMGVNADYKINNKSFLKGGLSVLHNKVSTLIDTFNLDNGNSEQIFEEESSEVKYSLFADYNLRTGDQNVVRTGIRWDSYDINYREEGIQNDNSYGETVNTNGWLHLLRAYAEDEYFFNERWRARAGLHTQYLELNESFALEPRAALRYDVSESQRLSLSYGMHHQMQPRTLYFVETPREGEPALTNKNLDFIRSQHLVLGYNLNISENLRVKAESYYQALDQIPVKNDPGSSFSLANVGADFFIPNEDSLVNEGRGRNYGVELTLEKFLSNGYYFMLNGSLYESEYRTANGDWYNTAFNLNYMWNALAGYEHWFNSKFALGADLRATQAGGNPYTPVNESASIEQNEVVHYEDRAFTEQFDDYFRLDLRFYYRINYNKFYMEFALDFQNLTDNENVYRRQFVPQTGEYNTFYHTGFFLMPTFKVQF